MTALDWTIVAAFLIANMGAFTLMGVDKAKAKRGSRRIPESTLLLWCGLLGGLGGWLGMQTFRHKTRHKRFTLTVPVMMLLQLVLLAVYFRYWR